MTDLYTTDQVTGHDCKYTFGDARFMTGTGVFSVYRNFPNRDSSWTTTDINHLNVGHYPQFYLDAAVTLTHELGHLLGLDHCIYFECNMNGSSGESENDAPLHMCPICLRKLQTGINKNISRSFSPMKRYRELRQFYKGSVLRSEYDWVTNRIQVLKTAAQKRLSIVIKEE